MERDIVESTKKGLKSALYDAHSFTESFSSITSAEYILTVNVAQQISKLGPKKGPALITINVEMQTKKFASMCVPLMKKTPISKPSKGFPRNKTVFRTPKNTSRNGKIDIAVLKQGTLEDKPVCAIELKGFNPTKGLVIKDIERNLDYFSFTGQTGKSKIEFTEFCALYQFPKTMLQSKAQDDLDAIYNRYKGYVAGLHIPSFVECEIQTFSASSQLLTGTETQDEYEDVQHDLHHHVGVIVIFRWKQC
ncbi:hypothetical protein [Vibrio parahaemolyticus]|uniref:hypothetical protein n=1 Tax=Vibrio parahaemolyticus TaxID=670 RepID=UPI00215C83BD|nr:hypothetical protein [Vibrio parahaemolyticus]MCS0042684.1 hypothetical protein [Vibrio parahaemolyticus]